MFCFFFFLILFMSSHWSVFLPLALSFSLLTFCLLFTFLSLHQLSRLLSSPLQVPVGKKLFRPVSYHFPFWNKSDQASDLSVGWLPLAQVLPPFPISFGSLIEKAWRSGRKYWAQKTRAVLGACLILLINKSVPSSSPEISGIDHPVASSSYRMTRRVLPLDAFASVGLWFCI